MNKDLIIAGIVILLVALFISVATCHGQVLCVEPPLQATPDEVLRLQVEFYFAQKGYVMNCDHYDYAVSFYYLGTQRDAAVTDFYSEFSAAPGALVGSVVTSPRQVTFGAWTMTARPKGKIIPIIRTHASSLSTAVKNTSKLLKHSPYL